MKIVRLIFLLGCLALVSKVSAQYLGDKITVQEYEGVWRWETESECFTLYLRDTVWKYLPGDKKEVHAIVGNYRYVRDGVVVDNTNLNLSPNRMPIYGSENPMDTDGYGNMWSLRLIFTETDTMKKSDPDYSRLVYSLGRYAPQLRLELVGATMWFDGLEDQVAAISGENPDSLRAISTGCKRPYWSVPNNITFTKVIE